MTEWKEFITSHYEIPDKVTDDWILNKLNEQTNDGFNMFMLWGFCYRDLSKCDLSECSKDVLLRVTFDTSTLWSEKLPQGFNPGALINNKRLGFGFEEAHKLGFTGKGVLVAVIDHPSNVDHEEIKERIKDYIVLNEEYDYSHFHGLSVLSMLCGKNIGIAPEVDVIFYAGQPFSNNEDDINRYAITCLQDIKKKILVGEPIRIVNMSNSWLLYGSEELKKEVLALRNELENLGCVIIDSPKFFESFRYLDCKGDDDFQHIDNYYLPPFFGIDKKDRLNFLSGGKLTASYLSKNEYKFQPVGSASYSIPQLVGFYALALQINPNLNYQEFVNVCYQNCCISNKGFKVVNPVATLMAIIKR